MPEFQQDAQKEAGSQGRKRKPGKKGGKGLQAGLAAGAAALKQGAGIPGNGSQAVMGGLAGAVGNAGLLGLMGGQAAGKEGGGERSGVSVEAAPGGKESPGKGPAFAFEAGGERHRVWVENPETPVVKMASVEEDVSRHVARLEYHIGEQEKRAKGQQRAELKRDLAKLGKLKQSLRKVVASASKPKGKGDRPERSLHQEDFARKTVPVREAVFRLQHLANKYPEAFADEPAAAAQHERFEVALGELARKSEAAKKALRRLGKRVWEYLEEKGLKRAFEHEYRAETGGKGYSGKVWATKLKAALSEDRAIGKGEEVEQKATAIDVFARRLLSRRLVEWLSGVKGKREATRGQKGGLEDRLESLMRNNKDLKNLVTRLKSGGAGLVDEGDLRDLGKALLTPKRISQTFVRRKHKGGGRHARVDTDYKRKDEQKQVPKSVSLPKKLKKFFKFGRTTRGAHDNFVKLESEFNQIALELDMPLKAGVSGNTDRLFRVNEVVGAKAPLLGLRAAALGALLPRRHHSFHEVMVVADAYVPDASKYAKAFKARTPYSPAAVAPLDAKAVFGLMKTTFNKANLKLYRPLYDKVP